MAFTGGYKRDRSDDGNNGYDFPPQKRYASGYAEGRDASPPPRGGDYNNSYGGHQPASAPRTQAREEKPSNVLLFTVFNPKYPITVDVMQSICSANNCVVNRIVIFRKNGVQAMVEFDTIDSADKAKESLNGADIYSGCCTLKVDWGKPTKLTVTKNDSDSWDYTVPPIDKEQKSVPLLPNPKFRPDGEGPPAYGHPDGGPSRPWYGDDYGYDRGYRPHGPGPMGPPDRYDPYRRDGPPGPERYPHYPGPLDPYHDPYGPPRRGEYEDRRGGGPPPRHGGRGEHREYECGPPGDRPTARGPAAEGCVVMVYGCAEGLVNCQKLFNLFCVYGNVVKIKFLKSKEGVAMVQMSDKVSCDRSIQNINGNLLYDSKLMVSYSKQVSITDVQRPATLQDGTISFVDYTGTRNNRFVTPEAASKNRIQPVAKSLYFFNAPLGLEEEDIEKIFIDVGVKPPIKSKMFPSRNDKCCTGILDWENKGDCIEALVMANHTILPNPGGKFPFCVKFSFADPHIEERRNKASE